MTYKLNTLKDGSHTYYFSCDGKPSGECKSQRTINTKSRNLTNLFFRMRELGWRRLQGTGKDICPLCVPEHFEAGGFQ